MKIIEHSATPDGTSIQLEDWSEYNSPEYPDLYGLVIGAYPIAKRTGRYQIIKQGHMFRLSISFNKYSEYNNEQVKSDYEALKIGAKFLEDLAPYFWNGEKDKFYLGVGEIE